jgi:diadenosine tetraphosphate (Ap4A) HIT family hydrolase
MPTPFLLDPRLAADTVPLIDLPLSHLLLVDDARFPWLILVPRRPDKRDLIDLEADDLAQLMAEVRSAGEALRAVTQPDKLNVAALGNMVPQLHVHVIARRRDDAAWPKPVWGIGEPEAYEPTRREALAGALLAALSSPR